MQEKFSSFTNESHCISQVLYEIDKFNDRLDQSITFFSGLERKYQTKEVSVYEDEINTKLQELYCFLYNKKKEFKDRQNEISGFVQEEEIGYLRDLE